MFDQFAPLGELPVENTAGKEAEDIPVAGSEAQEETGEEVSPQPENTQTDEEMPVEKDEVAPPEELPEAEAGSIIGQTFRVDGRDYQIESISTLSKSVHLRDLDFQRENGYPISRVEPYSVVQGLSLIHICRPGGAFPFQD